MSRFEQARDWALKELNRPDAQVGLASEDASFRSYYRIVDGQESWIIMDAPPEHETCEPYIKIADKMRATGVNTPEIIAQDLDNGFLLISDFGDTHYLKCFEGPDRNALYERALNTLDAIQSIEAG